MGEGYFDLYVPSEFFEQKGYGLKGLDLWIMSIILRLENAWKNPTLPEITRYALLMFPKATAQDILLSLSHLKTKGLISKKDSTYTICEEEV